MNHHASEFITHTRVQIIFTASQHGDEFSLVSQFILFFHFIYTVHMTGLLHEGIFHVQGLTKSVTFGSLHRH